MVDCPAFGDDAAEALADSPVKEIIEEIKDEGADW
jgi:hypothetical protein